VREHPHRSLREQSRHQGQESEGQKHRVSQKEELAGTNRFCHGVKLCWAIAHVKMELVFMLVTSLLPSSVWGVLNDRQVSLTLLNSDHGGREHLQNIFMGLTTLLSPVQGDYKRND
jgi:hypothetical protein